MSKNDYWIRYRLSILLYGILIFCIVLSVTIVNSQTDVFQLIPDKGAVESILLIMVILPGFSLVGLCISFILIPFFLLIHKILLGWRSEYAIIEKKLTNRFNRNKDTLFPVLLVMNFAFFIINTQIPTQILFQLMELVGFSIGLGFAVFMPSWTLDDAGIMYTNRNYVEKKENGETVEVRSVGGWLTLIAKGYAGLGILLNFGVLLNQIWSLSGYSINLLGLILLWGAFPFIIMILLFPIMIIFDLLKPFRIKFTQFMARKMGITKKLNLTIEIV